MERRGITNHVFKMERRGRERVLRSPRKMKPGNDEESEYYNYINKREYSHL